MWYNGTCSFETQLCQCNIGYIGDKCQTFVSKCDGYCNNDNLTECDEDVVDGQSPCICNEGYIDDTCNVLSKCYNYCIVGNFNGCNELPSEGQSPCKCNDGYIGDKCQTLSKCHG